MMSKYSSSEDVFKELVENSDENWLYGLVAFAIVEQRRIDWMKHFQENSGAPPNVDEIKTWYEQQPKSALIEAKGAAENALQNYSSEVIESMSKDYRKEIEQGIIVGEIRSLKRFWPQLGVNFAGGFLSAIFFASLLILMAFFVLNDTSPVEIGKQLNGLGVIDNGKEG